MHDAAILILTHVPDRTVARAVARALLDERLAACVNIGGSVESLYHWDGRIETGEEVPLVVKTRAPLYSKVEEAIRKFHPYDTPEIIAIPAIAVDRRYLDWLLAETRSVDARHDDVAAP